MISCQWFSGTLLTIISKSGCNENAGFWFPTGRAVTAKQVATGLIALVATDRKYVV